MHASLLGPDHTHCRHKHWHQNKLILVIVIGRTLFCSIIVGKIRAEKDMVGRDSIVLID